MYNGKDKEPEDEKSENADDIADLDCDAEEEEINEEVQLLCAEMDAINAALDKIEKQTDLVNDEIRKVLKENKKEREEINRISAAGSASNEKL